MEDEARTKKKFRKKVHDDEADDDEGHGEGTSLTSDAAAAAKKKKKKKPAGGAGLSTLSFGDEEAEAQEASDDLRVKANILCHPLNHGEM